MVVVAAATLVAMAAIPALAEPGPEQPVQQYEQYRAPEQYRVTEQYEVTEQYRGTSPAPSPPYECNDLHCCPVYPTAEA